MEATLTREEARSRAERATRFLEADPRVVLVYLFGSTVHGEAPLVRDVDLAISTRPQIDGAELHRLRADVVAAVGGAVDLVSLDGAPVVLAHEVADSGQCLFARDPDAEVEFVTRSRARYWDFKPFLDEQWRLLGERLRERLGGPPT
jgi:predicted nucleotidyltransferase